MQAPSARDLKALTPAIAARAQQVYDRWDQDDEGEDEELGQGGICDRIADAWADLLASLGFDASPVGSLIGENHTWLVVKTTDGVYTVDINPFHYETGGGYCWRKIPNVTFNAGMVEISRIDDDPDTFENYID